MKTNPLLKFLRKFVPYFIRRTCVVCRTPSSEALCDNCMRKLAEETCGVCEKCGKRYPFCRCMPRLLSNSGVSSLTHVLYYDKDMPNVSRALILVLKRHNRQEGFALIAELLSAVLGDRDGWIVTNVPRNRENMKIYGYDHAQKLAKELAVQLDGADYLPLLKNIGSGEQKKRSYEERVASALGSYQPKGKRDISGRRILLVDDIVTTGATMAECTRVLLDGGAKEVCAVAAARAWRTGYDIVNCDSDKITASATDVRTTSDDADREREESGTAARTCQEKNG